MKKNYLEPKIKVQTIALQSMMAGSSDEDPIIPVNPDPAVFDGDIKGLADDLFGNEDFGGAEEW